MNALFASQRVGWKSRQIDKTPQFRGQFCRPQHTHSSVADAMVGNSAGKLSTFEDKFFESYTFCIPEMHLLTFEKFRWLKLGMQSRCCAHGIPDRGPYMSLN